MNAFIRIGTNPRLHKRPLTAEEAISRVESWLKQPFVKIILPTDSHWDIFQTQIREASVTGNLVPDAQLAALAIEYSCTLYSSDRDFARFPSLKWRNPLAG